MPDDLGNFAQAALSRAASALWDGQREQYAPSVPHHAQFAAALLSGGDNRVVIDLRTGTNKYACPSMPAPDLVCFSSCIASPISSRGFERAGECYDAVAGALSRGDRAERLQVYRRRIEDSLLRYFGAASLADVILCPSGTDALLTAATLLAAERPGEMMTAILPNASETGTGVPLAAAGRWFDGPATGTPLPGCAIDSIQVPLRTLAGAPRSDGELNGAFISAAKSARGRPVIYLTHGSKTGLVAPTEIPEGFDVIVDACQSRIDPESVAAYLRRGWLVAVTGSKFFGGPAFSGALLFPRARQASFSCFGRTWSAALHHDANTLGMILRWTAALHTIEAFELAAADMAGILRNLASAVNQVLCDIPALVPIAGLPAGGAGWADMPSIFTFAVRDAAEPRRLRPVAELRLLYEHLARDGILLGQPVDLGSFGGLRIAISARDLLDGRAPGGLDIVRDALADVTASSGSWRRVSASGRC